MTEAVAWTCPTCRVEVETPFCARCGEEPVVPADLTLRGLSAKLVHALTAIDARALRSVGVLIRQPGRLTLAWTGGIRKPYIAPFQLFLIVNVVFFAVQWATGENVFSSSLDSHLHHQDWSETAQSLLTHRLDTTHRVLAEFAPTFDRVVVLNAKSLILLMALVFALPLPLGFLGERRPFMTHVVFALHLYTFLLLLFCVALLAARLSRAAGFGGLETPLVDDVLTVVNLTGCAVYLFLSIESVYGTGGVWRVAKTLLLTIVAAAIALGYRFVLFLITLYNA